MGGRWNGPRPSGRRVGMGHGHLDLLCEKELACRDDNLSLDALIVMAIRLDNLLRADASTLCRWLRPRSWRITSKGRSNKVSSARPLLLRLQDSSWPRRMEGYVHVSITEDSIKSPQSTITAKEPFVILTDNRNPEYIQTTRLNPRQARWALFFTRLDFTLTQVKKNTKADALSSLYNSGEGPVQNAPIIPSSRVVAPVVWIVFVDIRQALERDPAPTNCPPERIYVPMAIRDQLLNWAHTAVVAGHPGIPRPTQSISEKYWWPTLAQDITRYVNSCSVCAQTNPPGTLQQGNSFPCLSVPGPIYPLTLLLISPPLMVSPPFWWLWIDFQNPVV
ncbi:uncharacterized protein isoform X1 [Salmo salar]|uniref:Gypsy retrotransposon integrase-like protein 1 n=1 Tax=Salmo salar TaxID=8030 RepID=A0ABM3CA38_SALSA|nr:uncharacterized protein LOC106613737 isoform X1 [Salmo salar]